MLEKIKQTSVYKSLNLNATKSHAYFFYSTDKELNNNVALLFAKDIVCGKTACNQCNNCKMFDSLSHPDLLIIEKDSIKVEDANLIISKLATKPIISEKKVFIILNAENMNEISQNKLLKSLEEPNPNNIFILTASKTDKILPTVLSRVSKIFVPKLNQQDKTIIKEELISKKINIDKYLNLDISLTNIINYETNEEYKHISSAIESLLFSLKSSSDIPLVVSKIGNVNKPLFFSVLQNVFLASLKNNSSLFNPELISYVQSNYSEKAIIKCVELIQKSYEMLNNNVNFVYILDNLLFNMLKEKFLCK